MAKLSTVEETLRQVDTVDTLMLAKIEMEIEGVSALTRLLRRFEEAVKRFLRVAAVQGGGRRQAIMKVRDQFSPEMRNAICRMNLLAARIQFVNLELARVLRSSRVPKQRSFEDRDET